MKRRTFLSVVVGFVVAACSQQAADTTIQGIITYLQTQCNFITSVQSVTAVIATIISGFNAAAGASAVVIGNVASQVENLICGAVKAQVDQLKAEGRLTASTPGGHPEITVIVNNVPINGSYTGS